MPYKAKVKLKKVVRFPDQTTLLAGPSQRFANELMLTGVNHLNVVTPVDEGPGKASLQPNVTLTRVHGKPLANKVTWGTVLGYLRSLNEGKLRGPGKPPPIAKMIRHIRRRGIDTKPRGGRKSRGKAKDELSLAVAMSKSIAKKGQQNARKYVSGPLKGKPLKGWFDTLKPAVEQELPRLLDEFKRDVIQEFDRAIRS